MNCHCHLGRSAQAIAYRSHTDHPHDPSDLRRCVNYCRDRGISVTELRKRMAGRSPEWDALLPEWERLTALLDAEIRYGKDGMARLTYAAMREALSAVSA